MNSEHKKLLGAAATVLVESPKGVDDVYTLLVDIYNAAHAAGVLAGVKQSATLVDKAIEA